MIDRLNTFLAAITLNDLSLFFLTTFTSTIAGVFGLGGGLVTLPCFVPVNAIDRLLRKIKSFCLVSMLQTELGLVVGAQCPLTVTLLMKKFSHSDKL